jgi:hypothetical protein
MDSSPPIKAKEGESDISFSHHIDDLGRRYQMWWHVPEGEGAKD